MTNLETFPVIRHQGILSPPSQSAQPRGITSRFRSAMRRYFFYSGGVAVAALGLAMLATVLALSITSAPHVPGISLAEASEREPPLYFQFATALSASEAKVEADLAASPGAEPLPSDAINPAAVVAAPPRAPVPLVSSAIRANGVLNKVNITFYDCLNDGFCGAMYNGEKVYEGAAACSWDLPIGTAFYIIGDPTGRVYICKDRGLLDDTWVDIFWHNPADGYYWQSTIGRYGTIVLVSLPE